MGYDDAMRKTYVYVSEPSSPILLAEFVRRHANFFERREDTNSHYRASKLREFDSKCVSLSTLIDV